MKALRQSVAGVLAALVLLVCIPGATVFAQEPGTDYPRVLVTSCTVEGGGLVAGTTSEVSITLHNTSVSETVTSLLITGRWPDNISSVEFEQTNQVFLEQINPGESKVILFSVRTKQVNFSSLSSIACNLTISYITSTMGEKANTVVVQVPVNPVQEEPQQSEAPVLSQPISVEPEPVQEPAFLSRVQRQMLFLGAAAVCFVLAVVIVLFRRKRK